MTASTRLTVLGAGSWGTALAAVGCHNFTTVTLWGRDRTHMQTILHTGQNQRYLPGINLPPNLSTSADLTAASAATDCFLVAVPSRAFRDTLEQLRDCLAPRRADALTIVSATKGFDPTTNGLLSDTIRAVLGTNATCAVISGPSFARETAQALPTALTVASDRLVTAETIARWFITPSTRVYFSTDPVGVQLGGAIKNVIAIATGISDGLGYGANARAALITRGLSELSRLGVALGGQAKTFMGLTGVGDLILTCTDDQSRNRQYGMGLGAGIAQQTILNRIGQEVEGIHTVRELYHLSRAKDIEMPITEQVFHIVHQGKPPATAVQELLHRTPGKE